MARPIRRPFSGQAGMRWSSAAIVGALHVLVIFAVLLIDRRHVTIIRDPIMTLLHIAERTPPAPQPTLPPIKLITPAPITLIVPVPYVSSPPNPSRPAAQPETDAIKVVPHGLNLDFNPNGRSSVDKMFPSRDELMRRSIEEQARNDRIDNEKGGKENNEDCEVSFAGSDPSQVSSNGLASDHIPVTNCRSTPTLKSLQRRNDLYSPH